MPCRPKRKPSGRSRFVLSGPNPGLRKDGNIDLYARPLVPDPQGGFATVLSMSFGRDVGEILVPTVVRNRIVSDQARDAGNTTAPESTWGSSTGGGTPIGTPNGSTFNKLGSTALAEVLLTPASARPQSVRRRLRTLKGMSARTTRSKTASRVYKRFKRGVAT
jgi:hypothetical protein